jgi:hypothetical protein
MNSKTLRFEVIDWIYLFQDVVLNSYEHSKELSGFLKDWEFFEQVITCPFSRILFHGVGQLDS